MDSIVKLVWIQLQPDKLFDTTNKGKRFELREIEIRIEVRGNFSDRRGLKKNKPSNPASRRRERSGEPLS